MFISLYRRVFEGGGQRSKEAGIEQGSLLFYEQVKRYLCLARRLFLPLFFVILVFTLHLNLSTTLTRTLKALVPIQWRPLFREIPVSAASSIGTFHRFLSFESGELCRGALRRAGAAEGQHLLCSGEAPGVKRKRRVRNIVQ